MRPFLTLLGFVLFSAGLMALGQESTWQPVETPIRTPWGKEVTPENVWPEYPRPQLVRDEWQNLNGLWDYAVSGADSAAPAEYEGHILVPFCIEAPLSGVGRRVSKDDRIWYRRSFVVPDQWRGRHVLLHFEAVDWEATVWVNGQEVGFHRGGYDPFYFDITRQLKPTAEQELVVKVWDARDQNFQSQGKQNNTPDTYESSSGIWQTVWIEPVSEAHFRSLRWTPNVDQGEVQLEADLSVRDRDFTIEVDFADGRRIRAGQQSELTLELSNPRLWSPEDPHLYPVQVKLLSGSNVVDEVSSYFGMRKIERRRVGGVQRILLNGKPVFQFGPLDQNYWPESVLTPPSDVAMRWELEYLKRIGCNMVRLHIKQNPRRWYYHSDRLGLLVWQDFISAIKREKNPSAAASRQWLLEQRRLMDTLYSHPSIVQWVVFNESWNQHDTERITNWVMQYDPTRLISVASGWTDVQDLSDIRDVHDYTRYPSIPVAGSETRRAVVLGEFGGFNSVVVDHNWYDMGKSTSSRKIEPMAGRGGGMWPNLPVDTHWVEDYKRPTFTPGNALAEHFAAAVNGLRLLQVHGLCAAVYTQLTDMKHEQNGWLSFDRKVSKVDVNELHRMFSRLYTDTPDLRPIVDSGEQWKYTAETPPDSWTVPDFRDDDWPQGAAPFGNTETHPVHTRWDSPRLYLRRTFQLGQLPQRAALELYLYGQVMREQVDARVYLNGHLIQDSMIRHRKPELRVTAVPLRPETMALLHQGTNSIAVELTLESVNPRLFDLRVVEVSEW